MSAKPLNGPSVNYFEIERAAQAPAGEGARASSINKLFKSDREGSERATN